MITGINKLFIQVCIIVGTVSLLTLIGFSAYSYIHYSNKNAANVAQTARYAATTNALVKEIRALQVQNTANSRRSDAEITDLKFILTGHTASFTYVHKELPLILSAIDTLNASVDQDNKIIGYICTHTSICQAPK